MVKAKKTVKAPKSLKGVDTFDDFLETLDSESGGEDIDENVGSSNTNGTSGDFEEQSESDDDETEDFVEDLEQSEGEEEELGNNENENADDSEENMEEEDDEDISLEKHKKSLKNLEQSDPDFFAFLKENDAELLNFDDSEDETDDEDAVHKPSEELEVASDSEAEEELLDEGSEDHKGKVDAFLQRRIVNLHVIHEWEKKLSNTRDLGVFSNVIDAFECAVGTVLQGENPQDAKWRIEGSTNFNALIRLCIKQVKSFSVRFLCGNNNLALSENKFDQRPFEVIEKSKQKWTKLRPKIHLYMRNIVLFLKSMGNPDAICAVLRHVQKMSGFWAALSSKSYKLLRVLINIWSQGEDSCRVLAFISLIRMTNFNKDSYLLRVYKQMYMAYVSNCKFTSVNTWAAINFMRNSLSEIYLLDTKIAYSVAFPFIRQLAIHLRNAVTIGTTQQAKQSKKDASRIVYSWQFLHSLHVWVDVLAQSGASDSDDLKLLVYPVVQICLGTLKLIPTRKYIPLRFHIIKMLIHLQEKTKVFIPILPLATEVINLADFSAKSVSKFSVRPLDLNCCLKAEPTESGYSRAVADSIYDSILGACKAVATELSFPEIVTPSVILLKSFLKKKCKNAEMAKKFKTLIDKINANSTYINERRTKGLEAGKVSLTDTKSQQILRVQMETNKPYPPILVFANEYFKNNAKVTAKLLKKDIETKEEKLVPKPTVATKGKKKKLKDTFGKPLFSKSDSTSDSDDNSEGEYKTKLDIVEDEGTDNIVTKQKKKQLKRKNENTEVTSKKKKPKKKLVKKDEQVDVDDQLVDFELSD